MGAWFWRVRRVCYRLFSYFSSFPLILPNPFLQKSEYIFTQCGKFIPFSVIQITMLKKLSKCEVKAWLCWNFIVLLVHWFYVKSNFGKFKQFKSIIFGNFRGSNFWILILVNLSNFQVPNLPKIQSSVSKIAKNDIFRPFEFTKIGFQVKSEWQ